MLPALLCRQHEYTVPAALEFQPSKVHFRVQRFDVHLAIADFDDQQALLGQVIRRFGQHAPHQVQAVVATGQAQFRLMVVLIRHVGEILGIDIRRVGQDQVEALPWQAIETIALHGVDTLVDSVALDVLVRHLQRFEGQVGQHHFSVLELVGASDTDAAGAGAQVENSRRLGAQPGCEPVFDQFANR
ncbi:hypothetical protein D3C76_1368990 [compost metagenome]